MRSKTHRPNSVAQKMIPKKKFSLLTLEESEEKCHRFIKDKTNISFNQLLDFISILFLFLTFSRKTGLLLNNILAAIGAILMLSAKYANSFEMLIAGRLVIGINSGINAGISPMDLTEICPTSLRGAVRLPT